ncbi:PTS sugar transporter subunit IIB [Clostridium sp.]|uniref:PTS sugar transporter subunit IIB n=1 Tax=Clostridium sp. TaxID=1506 RepID=UPI0039F610BA
MRYEKKSNCSMWGSSSNINIAANKIVELCKKNGIDVEICQIRISEIDSNLEGADLIVTTSKVKRDYGVPLITGMPFISGVGVEKTEASILKVLKG